MSSCRPSRLPKKRLAMGSSLADWEQLGSDLSVQANHDVRAEVGRARDVVGAVCELMSRQLLGPWIGLAEAIVDSPFRALRSSLNALVRLPSDAALVSIASATMAATEKLPALRELGLLTATESSKTVFAKREELDERLRDATRRVEADVEDFARLVSLSADDALAGSYRDYAVDQAKKADGWRTAAVAVFAVSVAMAAVTVFGSIEDEAAVDRIAGRVGLSIALAALGAYLQHQSSLHRDREGQARSLEMTLRTLGPFSADLPEDESSRVRSAVGLALFAQPDSPSVLRSGAIQSEVASKSKKET